MKIHYFAPLVAAVLIAAGCAADTDYSEYISEDRYGLYLYEDDNLKIKLCQSQKETPFVADGVCGKKSALTEIFVSTPQSCKQVEITSESFTGGEMNYLSARGVWHMSFGGDVEGNEVSVTLTTDGKSEDYTLQNVITDDVMNGKQALDCVREHAAGLFEELTENGTFNGEIFLRLLYDGKCYYYVGICDREGKISAFLVDGNTGRIVAEREHKL